MAFCSCGYWATSTTTQTVKCPLCGSPVLCRSKDDQGRHAWHLLHSQPSPTPEWYEQWLKEIPTRGCLCSSHWRRLTSQHPPDFSSAEAFHRWAVAMHNDVNLLLGKPVWPYGS